MFFHALISIFRQDYRHRLYSLTLTTLICDSSVAFFWRGCVFLVFTSMFFFPFKFLFRLTLASFSSQCFHLSKCLLLSSTLNTHVRAHTHIHVLAFTHINKLSHIHSGIQLRHVYDPITHAKAHKHTRTC